METRRTGWAVLLMYLLIGFVLGLVSDITASALWDTKVTTTTPAPNASENTR